jgi:hypothetical protein
LASNVETSSLQFLLMYAAAFSNKGLNRFRQGWAFVGSSSASEAEQL